MPISKFMSQIFFFPSSKQNLCTRFQSMGIRRFKFSSLMFSSLLIIWLLHFVSSPFLDINRTVKFSLYLSNTLIRYRYFLFDVLLTVPVPRKLLQLADYILVKRGCLTFMLPVKNKWRGTIYDVKLIALQVVFQCR